MFQGIANLRSIDHYHDGSKCYCSKKNVDDVGLIPAGNSDSYNYHSSYSDATVFEVTSESVNEARFRIQQPPSTQPYSLFIGGYNVVTNYSAEVWCSVGQ